MLWITSTSSTPLHGIFFEEVEPPAQITPTGTGRVAIVAQFPWGPDTLYEAPDLATAKNVFAPPGMDRTSTGYLMLCAAAFPELVIARALGTGAAKAQTDLLDGSTAVFRVVAKFKGRPGNSIVLTVADASNGDADHWNLSASVTGASGTTTDLIENIHISGTGADAYPITTSELAKLRLLGGFTKLADGRPDNGTYTMNAVAASIVGTVALAAGGFFGAGGTLDTKVFTVTSDLGSATTTFSAPANASEVVSQINAQAGTKFVASLDGSNHLVLTSTTAGPAGTLLLGSGNANAVLGFTNAVTAAGVGGYDGTINATSYLGTPGQPSTGGAAAFEADSAVRHVFADDCGSGIRSAVNAGLLAHQNLMGDRIAYINGPAGVSDPITLRTNAGTYSSTGVQYCDPWVYIYDEVTRAEQLIPSAVLFASVAAQLPPSTSSAWKGDATSAMLSKIVRLEFDRGSSRGGNSKAGVATLFKKSDGGWAIEADVVTIAPANPAKRNRTRTAMGIFIAVSIAKAAQPYSDAPNVKAVWDLIQVPVASFLNNLKANAKTNPIGLAHVVDAAIGAPVSTGDQIADDELYFPVQVRTSSGIEKMVFLMQYGPNITVTLTNQ